jgi:predicted Ser/Thr protein kinase
MGSALLFALPALLLLQSQPTFYAAWEDGRDAERRGRFAVALAAYQRAIELRPRSAGQTIIYGNNLLQGYYPYTRIARCCLELGHWEAAERALAQAEGMGEPTQERLTLTARLREARPRQAETSTLAPVPVAPVPAAPSAAAPQPATQAPAWVPPALVPPQLNAPPKTVAPALAQERKLEEPKTVPAPPPEFRAPAVPAPEPQHTSGRAGGLWALAGAILAGGAALILKRRKKPAFDLALGMPERLGPYRVIRPLGRGGFASTYLARKDGSAVPVVLKVLHHFRQDDPEFLGRFRQEARLGSLLDHPGIVRLLDQGPQDDTPWLAMEFVEGRRLDVHLREKGLLSLRDVAELAAQLASAVAHAHGKGVVHRDLKPSNVMIVGTQAKVMDFGIARIMDSETLTTTYAFLGTPLYAAPELQTRTQVGPAADWYSFGILLFELIGGRPPFQGDTPFEILDQHRRGVLPDLRLLRPEAPSALVDLVEALTRKDPALRPGESEILAVLQGIR